MSDGHESNDPFQKENVSLASSSKRKRIDGSSVSSPPPVKKRKAVIMPSIDVVVEETSISTEQSAIKADSCDSDDEPSIDPIEWDSLAAAVKKVFGAKPVSRTASSLGSQPFLPKAVEYDTFDALLGLATTHSKTEPIPTQLNSHAGNNPLSGLPSAPLPPYALDFIVEKLKDANNTVDSSLTDRFDTSALVTVGMMVEEMITASLMPLAELHCTRVRQLESEENDEENDEDNSQIVGSLSGTAYRISNTHELSDGAVRSQTAFKEWTLPPEEAAMQLLASQQLDNIENSQILRSTLDSIKETIRSTPVTVRQVSTKPEKMGAAEI